MSSRFFRFFRASLCVYNQSVGRLIKKYFYNSLTHFNTEKFRRNPVPGRESFPFEFLRKMQNVCG